MQTFHSVTSAPLAPTDSFSAPQQPGANPSKHQKTTTTNKASKQPTEKKNKKCQPTSATSAMPTTRSLRRYATPARTLTASAACPSSRPLMLLLLLFLLSPFLLRTSLLHVPRRRRRRHHHLPARLLHETLGTRTHARWTGGRVVCGGIMGKGRKEEKG